MKVYVIKYFFHGDDIEYEIKGVYTNKSRAVQELENLVLYENENKLSEYDQPLTKVKNQLRYEGYIQHFGGIYYEIKKFDLN